MSHYEIAANYLRWHLLHLIKNKNDWRRRNVHRQQLQWMVARVRHELMGCKRKDRV